MEDIKKKLEDLEKKEKIYNIVIVFLLKKFEELPKTEGSSITDITNFIKNDLKINIDDTDIEIIKNLIEKNLYKKDGKKKRRSRSRSKSKSRRKSKV